MSDKAASEAFKSVFPNRYVYVLALIFVFLGVLNSMPTIPGWDDSLALSDWRAKN